jgi:hypothetical protein
MRYFVWVLLGASLLAVPPGSVAAQCEGGTTVAGYYRADGSYVPGGCVATNPFMPGQLRPSGAQPAGNTSLTMLSDTAAGTGAATVPVQNAPPALPRQGGGPRPARPPHTGDPTGAYGTPLPAAPPPPVEDNTPPAP